MNEKARTSISKFLSLVLRHRPNAIGIELNSQGWTDIGMLLSRCEAHGKHISRPMLDEIVGTSLKQRFAISEDGLRIRANQGHSVDVELGYDPAVPPEILYHGTIAKAVESIRAIGITRMKRCHVHLSPDWQTAKDVGSRRGEPVVLQVRAGKMHRDGHTFYLSTNGVWLTDAVPPGYIENTGQP